jgi:hypothetical protein
MAIPYNGVKMSDGTDFRVLVDFPKLVEAIDSALKTGGLLTLPMGIAKPGMPKTINLSTSSRSRTILTPSREV